MPNPILLVIEDDDMVLNLVTLYLEAAGHLDYVAVGDAKRAREMWQDHRDSLRLIVSDMTLPDGSGVELVREFLGENKEARAVLMTGFTAEYVELGAEINKRSVLLQKPFTRDEFTRIVKACLS
jgi:DNA-binding NtrC family response regulator